MAFKSSDYKAISGIHLILEVLKLLKKEKGESSDAVMIWKHTNLLTFAEQFLLVVNTAGDPVANNFFVKKLNILNTVMEHRFCNQKAVKIARQKAFEAGFIAISKHAQKWQALLSDTLTKALEHNVILEDMNMYPPQPLLTDDSEFERD